MNLVTLVCIAACIFEQISYLLTLIIPKGEAVRQNTCSVSKHAVHNCSQLIAVDAHLPPTRLFVSNRQTFEEALASSNLKPEYTPPACTCSCQLIRLATDAGDCTGHDGLCTCKFPSYTYPMIVESVTAPQAAYKLVRQAQASVPQGCSVCMTSTRDTGELVGKRASGVCNE